MKRIGLVPGRRLDAVEKAAIHDRTSGEPCDPGEILHLTLSLTSSGSCETDAGEDRAH